MYNIIIHPMELVKAFIENDMSYPITIIGTYENPLFKASDIAEILGIVNIRQNIVSFNDTQRVIQKIITPGGEQNIIFLTELGLYKLLFRSNKPIAEKFQNWTAGVIKEIRITGEYKLKKELEEKDKIIEQQKCLLEEKDNEIDMLQTKENVPMIYIFNTDVNRQPPELKIGYTTNLHNRIKGFKQTAKKSKLEFYVELLNANIRTVENFIHMLLNSYKIKDEVFELELEEAVSIVMMVCKLVDTTRITDKFIRTKNILRLYETQMNTIQNTTTFNVSTKEISTQTNDYKIEVIPKKTKILEFIEEMCIIHPDAKISAKRIEGVHRLWQGAAIKASREELSDYLKTNFKYIKIPQKDSKTTTYGYVGITVKEISIQKSLTPSIVEDFIFQRCTFIPEGTALIKDLEEEFVSWKRNLNKVVTNNERDEIRTFLRDNKNVLFDTVWANKGGGQGYYGIHLNSYDTRQPIMSSTSKSVEKIDTRTNIVVDRWNTIAKAAECENVSPAKMSRIVKHNLTLNEFYIYVHK
jgi:prophage antirepressor-like protein